MFYSRKERKKIARDLGLIKKNMTFKERMEQGTRANEAGKQISQRLLEMNENSLREQEVKREQKQLIDWIAAYGEDEARKMIADNRAIDENKRRKK